MAASTSLHAVSPSMYSVENGTERINDKAPKTRGVEKIVGAVMNSVRGCGTARRLE